MHLAVRNNHSGVVQLLLNQPGIDVNAQDKTGLTALHIACKEETDPAIFRILLNSHGIDPNLETSTGNTPIMVLLMHGFFNDQLTECLEAMIESKKVYQQLWGDFGDRLERVAR